MASPRQALCFQILTESPSIISIFSDSTDGKIAFQNMKSLEYYGDLSKVETTKDNPSSFWQILNSLLSFEPSDEINLGSVLAELDVNGSWVGSIKVPQHHSDPELAKEEASTARTVRFQGNRSSSPDNRLLDPLNANLPGIEYDSRKDLSPANSAHVQASAVSASFRKAPKKVQSLLMPSFKSALNKASGSSGCISSSCDPSCKTDDSQGSKGPSSGSSKQLSTSRSTRIYRHRSATFDGKSTDLDAQPALKIENPYKAALEALEAEMPWLVEADAVSKPPQVPFLEFESVHGNLKVWDEVENEGVVSAFASVKSNPTSTPFQWHDVSIKKLTHPVTGEPLILVTQNDVTVRVAMEKAMLACAHTQLNMVSTIFPLHVVEFFNQQRDTKRSAHDVAEPDIGQLARSHKDVTILFTDIVGFTSMSKEVPPAVVMKFLNDLFGRFDHLLEVHKVQKVETAGDCYIIASGVLSVGADGFSEVLSSHDPHLSASRVLSFAQSILRCSKMMRMPHNGEPVLIRIGIHTGDCVSGLVGSTLHKFGLFGDTMNTASRMESTCMPGRIQISASTYAILPQDCQAQFEATGGVEVKGKGRMETHLWIDASAEVDNLDFAVRGGLNVLGTEFNDPQLLGIPAAHSFIASQLDSLNIQNITKSQAKVSVGPPRRPPFEAMTQACHDAASLLHSISSESKTFKRSSNFLQRMPPLTIPGKDRCSLDIPQHLITKFSDFPNSAAFHN